METSTQNDRVRPWLHWIVVLMLFALVGLETLRSRSMTKLREENRVLREQLSGVEAIRAQNEDLEELQQNLIQSANSYASQLRLLHEDNARLREHTNQMASLRVQVFNGVSISRALERKIIELQSKLAAKPPQPRSGGWVGVSIRDAKAERPESTAPSGAVIMEIVSESPADKANLKKGDRVLAVDGEAIAGVEDFKRVMTQKSGGQTLAMDVVRENAIVRVAVQPRDWPY